MDWPAALPDAGAPPVGTVHCWRILVDGIPDPLVADLHGRLPPEEQGKADRFRRSEDRRRHILGRAGLRRLLGRALGQESSAIRLIIQPSGKPTLEGGGPEFNLSHSGNVVLIALGSGPALGVDVEQSRPMSDFRAVAQRFFHAQEIADLRRLPEAAALDAFFRCWTRKEAVSKAVGLGLGLPLDRYRVACLPHEPPRLLEFSGEEPPATWSIIDLGPADAHAGALAIPANPVTVVRRSLDAEGLGADWV